MGEDGGEAVVFVVKWKCASNCVLVVADIDAKLGGFRV